MTVLHLWCTPCCCCCCCKLHATFNSICIMDIRVVSIAVLLLLLLFVNLMYILCVCVYLDSLARPNHHLPTHPHTLSLSSSFSFPFSFNLCMCVCMCLRFCVTAKFSVYSLKTYLKDTHRATETSKNDKTVSFYSMEKFLHFRFFCTQCHFGFVVSATLPRLRCKKPGK